MKDIVVFHAGTIRSTVPAWPAGLPVRQAGRQVKYLTNGGRVLGVTGLGNTIKEAIDNTYQAVGTISFEGMHYRRDIGQKAVDSM